MKLSLTVSGNFEILTIFVNACKATIFIIYYLIHIYEETELALTRDSFGNIILQPFEESEFQKWTVQIQK